MKWRAFFWSNRIYFQAIWKRSKLYIICRILIIAAVNFSLIFNLFFLKAFVDAIIEKADFQLAICYLIFNFVVRFSTDQLITWLKVYLKHVHMSVQLDMQQKVASRSFAFQLDSFEDPAFYDIYKRALEYATTRSEGIVAVLSGVISDIIGLSAVIYIVSRLNVVVLLVLLVIVVLDLAVNMRRDSLMDALKRRLTRIHRRQQYMAGLLNNKSAFKDIKLHNAGPFILHKLKTIYQMCRKETMDLEIKTGFLKMPVRLMESIFIITVYYFIGRDLFNRLITIGDFNMTYNAAYSIKAYLISIGLGISELRKMRLDAAYFYEYFTLETPPDGMRTIERQHSCSIEFRHVYFRYLDTQDWILNDVSFQISPGEKVLLVGENGAGKTTIIHLLLRLYRPDSGDILLNGISINEYDISSLYEAIAVVFQDHQEYAFSLAENIALEEPDVLKKTGQEALIKQALDLVHLQKVVQLPEGIYTALSRELDDNGSDLSGGERQKLAIARALIRKAVLYVLDEPSSSLDPLSEEQMYQALWDTAGRQTTIVISHHLSNCIYADHILVVHQGKIVEEGRHEELMALHGLYAQMYTSQSKKYGLAKK